MNSLKIITLGCLLALSTVVSAQTPAPDKGTVQGPGKGMGQGHQAMMMHANPMPNLMRVITLRGDELDLSEEQSAALAEWRKASHGPMYDMVKKVAAMEKDLNAAALAGVSKAELMGKFASIVNVRRDIVSGKANCRDNMRRILSAEQFDRVLAMYAEM